MSWAKGLKNIELIEVLRKNGADVNVQTKEVHITNVVHEMLNAQ